MLSSNNETCVFQAPTGSGKTVIVAELLKELVKTRKERLAIIWIAPRKLHNQSKNKLETYYDDRILECSNFEDLNDNKIQENEILFFNWESINKKNNTYIMDNEEGKNLSNIVSNTHDDGIKIILIIDESHHSAHSENAQELIDNIKPDITLEVSATPNLSGVEQYTVRLKDVQDAEMIKREVIINPKFMDIKVGSKSADEIVIEQAIKQRQLLKNEFEKEKSNVNPLVLIQLPDKKALLDDKKQTTVKILEKLGITEINNKLAIWLSEDKSDTLIDIENIDNSVEVLIFKQAISLGWDCPRASILVLFRETKSQKFSIQTIGRIMRMPELKYYSMPELNNAYVFTNLDNIEIVEKYAKEIISYQDSYRKSPYMPINLQSIYIQRQREKTRLSGEFTKIFNDPSRKSSLKNKIREPQQIIKYVISDGKKTNVDDVGGIEFKNSKDIPLHALEIQREFDAFIGSCCKPFAPHDSSNRIKTALYQFLEREFNVTRYSPKAQSFVLDVENYTAFEDEINIVKEEYKNKINTTMKKIDITEYDWEIPETIMYKNNAKEVNTKKCIMSPFYVTKLSKPEERFIKRLDESKNVLWWYKNGENEKKYFAVKYIDDEGVDRSFYVDFIVMFKNGCIGLFDTKEGRTADEAGPKHDGLYEYIEERMKGREIFGGITVDHKSNTFVYYNKKEYHYDENNMSDWTLIDL